MLGLALGAGLLDRTIITDVVVGWGSVSSSALAVTPAITGWGEGVQFGKSGGFRVSETENLILERSLIALDLLASLAQ